MASIINLLERYWILKNKDKELYYEYKNLDRETKDFLREKLGFNLIVNQHLVKLEKVPVRPEAWMGIKAFTEPRDYVFLCLLLSFLENKSKDEQFLLSHITEYIQVSYPNENLDWTLYSNRKALIRVLDFAVDMSFIKIDDGSQEAFSEYYETEVLYECTGLSRYFIRNFPREYTGFNSWEEILDAEWLAGDNEKGIPRRMRAYRGLFLDTAVYDDDENLFLYIKNFRNILQSDLEKYLGAELHTYKSCAFAVVNDNSFREVFPEDKNICDIAIMFLKETASAITAGRLELSPGDRLMLTASAFNEILSGCMESYSNFWNKDFRAKSFDAVKKELLLYLKKNKMLEQQGDAFTIMPLAFRFTGRYPEDFTLEDTVDE